jgi:hypothetical protein
MDGFQSGWGFGDEQAIQFNRSVQAIVESSRVSR